MNGPVVRRRVTFPSRQVRRDAPAPRPPHPIDASYRIVQRCLLDTHVAPPHTCVLSPPPPVNGSSHAAPRSAPGRPHAGRAAPRALRSTYKKSARTGPSYAF